MYGRKRNITIYAGLIVAVFSILGTRAIALPQPNGVECAIAMPAWQGTLALYGMAANCLMDM